MLVGHPLPGIDLLAITLKRIDLDTLYAHDQICVCLKMKVAYIYNCHIF